MIVHQGNFRGQEPNNHSDVDTSCLVQPPHLFPGGKTPSVVCSVSLQSVSQWEQELSSLGPSGVTLWPNFILFPQFLFTPKQ